MSNEWYPEIDEELCIGCKKCIDVCNSGVFETLDKKVKVMYIEKCIFECNKCQELCSNKAIYYVLDVHP